MIKGRYFAPNSPRAHEATLARAGLSLLLTLTGEAPRRVDIKAVSEPLAEIPRKIMLYDGGTFEAPFDADFESIGLNSHSHVSRWEGTLRVAAFFLIGAVITVIALWRWGIPFAAEVTALHTSPNVLMQMDQLSLESLEGKAIHPSTLPKAQQERLHALFNMITHEAQIKDLSPRLLIRSMPRIGANAFALPGGTIILSDQLVREAQNDDEVAGVLAHEIGHVQKRHSLRQLYSALGTTTLVSIISTGPGALVDTAMSLGAGFLDLTYSRDFEREADLSAVAILRKTGINPAAFLDLLERIEGARSSQPNPWLSTHPTTEDRKAHLRQHLRD